MIMREMSLHVMGVVLALSLLAAGCDVGTNPVILDGVPVSASMRIDGFGTIFTASVGVPLQPMMESVDEVVDSVNLYNLTLLFDSNNTPTGTTLTASITINGNSFIQFNGVKITEFASERSIFDPTLPNTSVNPAGMAALRNALRKNPPQDVMIATSGSASSTPHFTAHVKIYTQLYTSP